MTVSALTGNPTRARLTPGELSPRRTVPRSIARPFYVDAKGNRAPGPADHDDPMIKDSDTIAAMRVAGRIAAQALQEVGRHVAPGVTTDDLDRIGHEFLVEHGAYPSTLGYKGFPKSLCTSLNESICHGIPDSTVIEDGDIVKVDVTAYIGGVHGDNCGSFLAGNADEAVVLLAERTHEATLRAIRAVRPGREVNVIGRVIESYARRFGYGVVRDYTGHGVGPSFHTKPTILHYDEPAVTTRFEPGMTFTIEPMIALGRVDWTIWDDGWTVVTDDGSWVAQWEHTIVVTDDGAEILTLA
jgi:methionyl aminopeptidase